MGSTVSSIFFQPVLLGLAIALMVSGLVYKSKKCEECGDKKEDIWGFEVYKLNVGFAITIIITSILLGFISAFEI